jgi:superfamily II DNA helicase RecQ
MNSQVFPADEEVQDFSEWLRSAEPGQRPNRVFKDELFSRCADAVETLGRESSQLDMAILVRHAIRRMSERDGQDFSLFVPNSDPWPGVGEWQEVGVNAVGADACFRLRARPWRPEWLWNQGDPPVDEAAVAGTYKGTRGLPETVGLPADPFFTEMTSDRRYKQYRSPGQKAAVRAALTIPEDGALLAILPTGTGKTEIALALAKTARQQTTVIVIPTITLAHDFEKRFREVYETDEPFAWVGTTTDDDRTKLQDRFVTGQQPILVITPDSLEKRLRDTIKNAAGAGRLRALVIDEAHLFTQWGRSFKPQYREMAALRREILDRARSVPGQVGFRTVLLSATVGAAELKDLHYHFGSPGPFSVVAANSFRREHDYWVSEWSPPEERKSRVMEAVLHLPRPLLLYVTRPEDAKRWKQILQSELGLKRVGIVHGQTPGDDRRDVLEAIRAGPGETSRFDVVVGNSAFGLGIDYGGFRSVVHACLPETIDRWYQEVGRTGRDGHAATALLIPARSPNRNEDDAELARSLGVKPLREAAFPRWEHLWTEAPSGARTRLNRRNYVNVKKSRSGGEAGSYNLTHNRQLLYGLEEIDAISRRTVSSREAEGLGLEVASETGDFFDWVEVEITEANIFDPDFFENAWEKWRVPIVEESVRQFETMNSLFDGPANVCQTVFENYTPPSDLGLDLGLRHFAPRPPCGRCPACRHEGVRNPDRPPPTPPNSWIPVRRPSRVLTRVLRRCKTKREVSLSLFVHTGELESEELDEIADRAEKAGVRWFVGCKPTGAIGGREPYFVDRESDVDEINQLPVPSLLILRDAKKVQGWLSRYHPPYLFPESVEGPPVILVCEDFRGPDDPLVALRHSWLKRLLGPTRGSQ